MKNKVAGAISPKKGMYWAPLKGCALLRVGQRERSAEREAAGLQQRLSDASTDQGQAVLDLSTSWLIDALTMSCDSAASGATCSWPACGQVGDLAGRHDTGWMEGLLTMFTAASQRTAHRLGVNNVQARAWRLGLGLMASAPHHRPRGHHHPQDRKRLDFGFADNLFVSCISVDFSVATGARAFCMAPA